MKFLINQLGRWLALGALVAVAIMAAGCGSTGTNTAAYQPQTQAPFPDPNTPIIIPTNAPLTSPGITPPLRAQDLVIIEWFDTPTPMPQYRDRVRQDGNLVLPYNVVVRAVGLNAGQLQDAIHKAYVPRFYNHLTVTVKTEERFYYVGGEVKNPNRHYYYGDMTVLRAVDTASGFTDFADKRKIELRRSNGQSFMIDWKKAMRNPKHDLPVYPNDQVIVHKRWL